MDFKVVCGDEIKYGKNLITMYICAQYWLRVLICNALILMTAYVLIWGDLMSIVFLGSVWRILFLLQAYLYNFISKEDELRYIFFLHVHALKCTIVTQIQDKHFYLICYMKN